LLITGIIKLKYRGKKLFALGALTLFQPIAYMSFETAGINLISSSEAGIMIALIPIVTALFGALFLKEKTTFLQNLCIFLSVTGVIFIFVFQGQSDFQDSSVPGLVFLFVTVISASVYKILARKLSIDFTPMEITFSMIAAGAIFFNLVTFFMLRGEGAVLENYFAPLADPKLLIAVIYLGGFCSIIAFFLVNYMVSEVPAFLSAVFANLTTVIAILTGVFLRNETLHWFQLVGSALIISGVWGVIYLDKKPKEEEQSSAAVGR
jgi:drug/metabolite transporter (DMT)-like permease